MEIYTTLAWSFVDELERVIEEEIPVIDTEEMVKAAEMYKVELTNYSIHCYFLTLSTECLREFLKKTKKLEPKNNMIMKPFIY